MQDWFPRQIGKNNTSMGITYISVTDEPEHLIPFQPSPHGSPPLSFQPLSCSGLFRLLNITLRAETTRIQLPSVKIAMQKELCLC